MFLVDSVAFTNKIFINPKSLFNSMIQNKIIKVLREKEWLLASELSEISELKIYKIQSALKKMLKTGLIERKPVKHNQKRAFIYNLVNKETFNQILNKIEVQAVSDITSKQLKRLPINGIVKIKN